VGRPSLRLTARVYFDAEQVPAPQLAWPLAPAFFVAAGAFGLAGAAAVAPGVDTVAAMAGAATTGAVTATAGTGAVTEAPAAPVEGVVIAAAGTAGVAAGATSTGCTGT
jgi:hypothetical protein